MSTLNKQPFRIPLTDPSTGQITREWSRFIEQLVVRVGGEQGLSNSALEFAVRSGAFDRPKQQKGVAPGEFINVTQDAANYHVSVDINQVITASLPFINQKIQQKSVTAGAGITVEPNVLGYQVSADIDAIRAAILPFIPKQAQPTQAATSSPSTTPPDDASSIIATRVFRSRV